MATKNEKNQKPQNTTFCEYGKCKLLDLPQKELVKLISPEVQSWVMRSLSMDDRYNGACPEQISVDFIATESEDTFEAPRGTDVKWEDEPFESTIEVRGRISYFEKDKKDLKFRTFVQNINGSKEVSSFFFRVYVTDDDADEVELKF